MSFGVKIWLVKTRDFSFLFLVVLRRIVFHYASEDKTREIFVRYNHIKKVTILEHISKLVLESTRY